MDKQFQPISLQDADVSSHIIQQINQEAHRIQSLHSDIYTRPVLHSDTELLALYDIAFGLHDNEPTEGHIIQCGTYRGGSTAVLATAVKHRALSELVTTIDCFTYLPDQTHKQDVFIAHKLLIENLSLEAYVASVWHDDIWYMSNFLNCSIRLAVLDSSHGYQHVTQQLTLITSKIINGGWVAIHDYNSDFPGVVEAVNAWLDELDRGYKLFQSDSFVFINIT